MLIFINSGLLSQLFCPDDGRSAQIAVAAKEAAPSTMNTTAKHRCLGYPFIAYVQGPVTGLVIAHDQLRIPPCGKNSTGQEACSAVW